MANPASFQMTFEFPHYAGLPPFEGTVYHYTDDRGLIGVVERGEIWATAVSALNDGSELRHGRKLVRTYWNANRGEIDHRISEAVDALLPIAEEMHTSYFVACASTKGNSLTQFRTYGGVAIGLDAHTIYPRANRVGFPNDFKVLSLPPAWRGVIYKPAAQDAAIKEFFDRLVHSIPAFGEHWMPSENEIMTDIFSWWYINLVALLKHRSFKQEREVRLTIVAERDFDDVYFRPSRYGVAPYVKLTTMSQEEVERPLPLPIASVRIGPHRYGTSATLGTEALLKKSGYEVPVNVSKAPYRD